MKEFLNVYGIWLGFMVVASVLAIIYSIGMNKKNNRKKAKFLEENPNAARIFMTMKGAVVNEVVQIITVNGEEPIKFTEKLKGGVYAKPGSATLEVNYTYTRPGVMYKSVSESTGIVSIEVEVEANKSYKIGYDRKAQDFTFEEI